MIKDYDLGYILGQSRIRITPVRGKKYIVTCNSLLQAKDLHIATGKVYRTKPNGKHQVIVPEKYTKLPKKFTRQHLDGFLAATTNNTRNKKGGYTVHTKNPSLLITLLQQLLPQFNLPQPVKVSANTYRITLNQKISDAIDRLHITEKEDPYKDTLHDRSLAHE